MKLFHEDAMLDSIRAQAGNSGRSQGENFWNPPRVALCTCGWASRHGTLAEIATLSAIHEADGCEGCDHAVRIEYRRKQ